jgi:hypothetical protein
MRSTSGSDYRLIYFDGGNSLGYLFTNFPALSDGLHLLYNFVYPSGSMTPSIINPAGGTSRLTVTYDHISLCAGTTNTNPTEYLRIASGGNITAMNSGTFIGNLTGNVTGTATGLADSFTNFASYTGTWASVPTDGPTTYTFFIDYHTSNVADTIKEATMRCTEIAPFTATSSTYFHASGVVPVALRVTQQFAFAIPVVNNGVAVMGCLVVNGTNEDIYISPSITPLADFANSVTPPASAFSTGLTQIWNFSVSWAA